MLGYARILNSSRGDLQENPLRVGELVRLRSGGPVMVVVQLDEEGGVSTRWHDRVGVLHNDHVFAMETLERARRGWGKRRWFGG